MKKVSFIIPHFKTWKWTAICLWHLKTFGIPVEQEIILVDNSPGHPSIRAISDTILGEGINIVTGDREFTSHGMAYGIGFAHATGDRIFTCETDSFPYRHGWFDEYAKLAPDYAMIGPEIPQSSGRYIHPAGCLTSRRVVEDALKWQQEHIEWIFLPGAAVKLGTSDRQYHVVAHGNFLQTKEGWDTPEVDIWERAGPWQEMRCFDDDTFENYSQRTGITSIEPVLGQFWHNKIGFEAGQWLAYFAACKGYRLCKATTEIKWMPGHHGQQAAYADVFQGFRHIWCGTVSNLVNDINPEVRAFKIAQQDEWWEKLPRDLRREIEAMESA